ncbi:Protein kinase, putative [Hondaea fermentalgiana]|uniref:cGMP-dependent protein kinase n=1 Tax=Hondaea fermentalgiana TaxID=2315210 RepID=A0A2R5GX23_9STRA|nr:Protein kinase, putative [Hondaea fermentalgiana]|eukprot:GBG33233.1 Protein kinase, putative [Hondaea fermentalgiana]
MGGGASKKSTPSEVPLDEPFTPGSEPMSAPVENDHRGSAETKGDYDAAPSSRSTKDVEVMNEEKTKDPEARTKANDQPRAQSANVTESKDDDGSGTLQIGQQVMGRDEESKRFREKKKGFTGFRAELEGDDPNSGLQASGIRIEGERAKSEEDKEKARERLSDFPLFDPELYDDLFEGMSEARCPAGRDIFIKDAPFMYFVLLIEGEMQLDDENVNFGNEQALLGPGLCVGTLRAVTDCRLWVISRLQYQKVTVEALKRKLERGGSLLENITEIPGLRELPRETREAIAAALKPITFVKGEYLMRQGEQGHTMYFIEEGEVIITQSSNRHTSVPASSTPAAPNVVARRTRGEYIGEGALLDEGNESAGEAFGVRNASAIADSDVVKCLALGRNEFQEYMGSLRELFEHNLCYRVLSSLDLMKDLDSSQIALIASTLEEVEFAPGEYVVHQGEEGDIFYIVKDGTLECTLTEEGQDKDAEPKRVGTLISGDYFGEGALLTNAPRRCNVFAVGPGSTKVWGLRRSNFENFLSEGLKQKLGDTFMHRKSAKENKKHVVPWDKLQKIQTLGSGSYGTVDLVRDRVTGETYALKRIRKATVVAKKQQRFIKNERELMSATHSPFLVNLVCTYNKGDSVYMLTEVCLGGELYSLMKDTVDARNADLDDDDDIICGCFELESQCRFYTACIVLAIEYMHSQGIIHRDMKPENLLLTENGYLKLADFGFAKMVHDQRTYSLCGTPEYTAPEVYKRSGHSKGVDWWSLGVILYEMASGFSPFHVVSQNSWDCYIEISKYEKYYPSIQFPPLFGPELCSLLLRLLCPSPSKRYGTRKSNASHVKEHPFFGVTEEFKFAVDWEKIENRSYSLAEQFRPRVPESGLDANNFDSCDDRHEEDEKFVDESMMESGGTWYNDF